MKYNKPLYTTIRSVLSPEQMKKIRAMQVTETRKHVSAARGMAKIASAR